MTAAGRLAWEAPAGDWLVLRLGHASNLKMTRPSPAAAVGLECDRLARIGIDTHYAAFLKPIFERAGLNVTRSDRAGRSRSPSPHGTAVPESASITS